MTTQSVLEAITWQDAKHFVTESTKRICSEHGGPMQYLLNTYNSPANINAFSASLRAMLPPDDRLSDDVQVQHDEDWLGKVHLEQC